MRVHIRVNPRNLSNAPQTPTYGFKIPIRYIRALRAVDVALDAHLQVLAGGQVDTYTRDVTILWPLRGSETFSGHISYTYTGPPNAAGGYSSQGHVSVTDGTWTPRIVATLGSSLEADYFQGVSRDLIVISEP